MGGRVKRLPSFTSSTAGCRYILVDESTSRESLPGPIYRVPRKSRERGRPYFSSDSPAGFSHLVTKSFLLVFKKSWFISGIRIEIPARRSRLNDTMSIKLNDNSRVVLIRHSSNVNKRKNLKQTLNEKSKIFLILKTL